MSIVSEIKLLGADLEDGETIRPECPSCKEADGFTLTRNSNCLIYNCFRVSCSLRPGIIGEGNVQNLLRNKPQPKQFTPYQGPLEPLSKEWKTFLKEKVGFTELHLELANPMYSPSLHRIAYPIYGPLGNKRGYMLRSYSLGVSPKALIRMNCSEPVTSWYRCQKSNYLIVVEDIPSAVRAAVAGDMNSLSMNGSHLGEAALEEILKTGITDLILAFDNDATTKAIEHHNKYKIFFNSCKVLPLNEDLKDMQKEDLCRILTEKMNLRRL